MHALQKTKQKTTKKTTRNKVWSCLLIFLPWGSLRIVLQCGEGLPHGNTKTMVYLGMTSKHALTQDHLIARSRSLVYQPVAWLGYVVHTHGVLEYYGRAHGDQNTQYSYPITALLPHVWGDNITHAHAENLPTQPH